MIKRRWKMEKIDLGKKIAMRGKMDKKKGEVCLILISQFILHSRNAILVAIKPYIFSLHINCQKASKFPRKRHYIELLTTTFVNNCDG